KSEELRLDLGVVAPRTLAVDQTALEHRPDVGQVLAVRALELGERLRVEVEVVEGQPSLPPDRRAPLLPARRHGNELRGRRELDVDVQVLLRPLDRAEERVRLR